MAHPTQSLTYRTPALAAVALAAVATTAAHADRLEVVGGQAVFTDQRFGGSTTAVLPGQASGSYSAPRVTAGYDLTNDGRSLRLGASAESERYSIPEYDDDGNIIGLEEDWTTTTSRITLTLRALSAGTLTLHVPVPVTNVRLAYPGGEATYQYNIYDGSTSGNFPTDNGNPYQRGDFTESIAIGAGTFDLDLFVASQVHGRYMLAVAAAGSANVSFTPDDGGNGGGHAVPTPAALLPGLALITGLAARRRRA